jgi:SAM-dependent methyltransferase
MTLREQLLSNPFLECRGNIFYQKNLHTNNPFEKAYLNLRAKEKRILSDDVVKILPDVDKAHPNKKEWEMRKSSLSQVIQRLKKSSLKRVLELGCGNGWFAHKIVSSLQVEICAVDVNEVELIQAARVFNNDENLCFAYIDIFAPVFKPGKFDAIILGSSVQYFSNLEILFGRLFELLESDGSIYIFDSPFYRSKSEAENARKRSSYHFSSLKVSEMADQYFHHTFDDLKRFKYKVIYNPKSVTSLFKRKSFRIPLSIFPIICIKNNVTSNIIHEG